MRISNYDSIFNNMSDSLLYHGADFDHLFRDTTNIEIADNAIAERILINYISILKEDKISLLSHTDHAMVISKENIRQAAIYCMFETCGINGCKACCLDKTNMCGTIIGETIKKIVLQSSNVGVTE